MTDDDASREPPRDERERPLDDPVREPRDDPSMAPDATPVPDDGDAEDDDWRFDPRDLGGERRELTPGSPDPEHVLFVLLGALVTVFALGRLFVF